MQFSDKAALARAYAASLWSYYVDGVPRPFSASFAVTNNCNLRCSYCNFPYLDRRQLTLEQIETLFDRLHRLGVRRLGLVGGEPLLRDDLADIVASAKRHEMFVTLNTNLTLAERRPDALAKVDLIFTSLDGDESQHNANRGQRAFAGVLNAVGELRRRGKKVVLICVVTANNLDAVDWLLATANELDVEVHFQAQCTETKIVRGQVSPDIENQCWRDFWRDLSLRKANGARIASSLAYLRYLSQWQDFSKSAYHSPSSRCGAGVAFMFVDPLGTAYPCAYTNGAVPGVNLLQTDWRENFPRKTPCTECLVGPMLEFNLLLRQPMAAAWSALRSYG